MKGGNLGGKGHRDPLQKGILWDAARSRFFPIYSGKRGREKKVKLQQEKC